MGRFRCSSERSTPAAAIVIAAIAFSAAVVAGCGLNVASPDLFVLNRTGQGKPLTLLVNDSCFGVLKNYQLSAYGHTTGVDLRSPDFAHLAAAYGAGYRRIERTADAGDALTEAIAARSQGCQLIELQAELAAPPQSI